MKKLAVAAALFAFSSPILRPYEYIMNSGAKYYGLGVDAPIAALTGGNWDDGYYDHALPTQAQFHFYGRKVTHLRIWTNGYVTFGFGSAPTDLSNPSNASIPSPDTPNSYAAPWWDDWNLDTEAGGYGEIWVRFTSVYTTIEWRNVAHKADSTARYRFSVVFCGQYRDIYDHVNNGIVFNYIDTDSGTGVYDHGVSGTVGIEHYTGLQGERHSYNSASLNNNSSIHFTPFVPVYAHTDFWGVGKADLCIFRPDNGYWYIYQNPATGTLSTALQWGMSGDVAVPGDYDGNGDADECVYRPSDSYWYCENPSYAIQWGKTGDIPVPADYDGDGRTDIAVFRPYDGTWYIMLWGGGSIATQWGKSGDIPIPGDVDDDNKADPVVWRPENAWFYAKKSTGGTLSKQGGQDGDIPNLGRNSVANAEPLVFRPSNGIWHTTDWGGLGWSSWQWGQEGDLPMPVDWLGTGYTWFMIYRADSGTWYQKQSSTENSYQWGMIGDKARCRRSHNIALPGSPADGGTAKD
jgi:hypothetical protein